VLLIMSNRSKRSRGGIPKAQVSEEELEGGAAGGGAAAAESGEDGAPNVYALVCAPTR